MDKQLGHFQGNPGGPAAEGGGEGGGGCFGKPLERAPFANNKDMV